MKLTSLLLGLMLVLAYGCSDHGHSHEDVAHGNPTKHDSINK